MTHDNPAPQPGHRLGRTGRRRRVVRAPDCPDYDPTADQPVASTRRDSGGADNRGGFDEEFWKQQLPPHWGTGL
ncbi:hypothetical protein ACFSSC_08050 [Corynebacterium mendelii]|uniref:Uncharacterized protein n=1 Tax=Corynebacterium mendelii TaxID=2765362 RepID=A0A939E1H1_9CORY|nr:hypothetical protein [Corynebacterium mendelii]MBN9644715.1 hypothetical protein [Corynebacterium mendelii]